MDCLKHAISNKYGLSFIYVDVSETAATLEQKHLNGPATGVLLGQSIVGSALLSSRLKGALERVTFQVKTDGPIGGIIVDTGCDGLIRGYTDVKLLADFDGVEDTNENKVLGGSGVLSVIRSDEKGTIYSGQVSLSPPEIKKLAAKYLNQSEQVPTGVEIFSKMHDFKIAKMTGIMVQKLPGADTEKFVHVLEKFDDGSVSELLENFKEIIEFSELFEIDDLKLISEKELKFGCRCSYEKSLSIMGSLEMVELQGIIERKEDQKVTCHFCGETYKLKWENLQSVLLDKADISQPI